MQERTSRGITQSQGARIKSQAGREGSGGTGEFDLVGSVLTRQKPEIVAIDTQIAHSEKRVADMTKTVERVKKDEERQAESLASLEEGAAAINERMEEAAGKFALAMK